MQILLVSALRNVQRTVWRICLLILGSKWLKELKNFAGSSIESQTFKTGVKPIFNIMREGNSKLLIKSELSAGFNL